MEMAKTIFRGDDGEGGGGEDHEECTSFSIPGGNDQDSYQIIGKDCVSICDGHGVNGQDISKLIASKSFPKEGFSTERSRDAFSKTIDKELQQLALQFWQEKRMEVRIVEGGIVQYKIPSEPKWNWDNTGGSTATFCQQQGNQLDFSWVGDSEALVIEFRKETGELIKFEVVTQPHDASRKSEQERMTTNFPLAEGGSSVREPSEPPAFARFCYDSQKRGFNGRRMVFPISSIDPSNTELMMSKGGYHKNVSGDWSTYVVTQPTPETKDTYASDYKPAELAVTRSFGDPLSRRSGVISKLDYRMYEINQDPEIGTFVIMASDGVWDNWVKEEMVNRFLENYFADGIQEATTWLSEETHRRAVANFGKQHDDMTCIVKEF